MLATLVLADSGGGGGGGGGGEVVRAVTNDRMRDHAGLGARRFEGRSGRDDALPAREFFRWAAHHVVHFDFSHAVAPDPRC